MGIEDLKNTAIEIRDSLQMGLTAYYIQMKRQCGSGRSEETTQSETQTDKMMKMQKSW